MSLGELHFHNPTSIVDSLSYAYWLIESNTTKDMEKVSVKIIFFGFLLLTVSGTLISLLNPVYIQNIYVESHLEFIKFI